MMPKNIDVWAIRMHLEFGTPPRDIAAAAGESLEMLVHLLSVHGCPDLATRLANATKPQRRQHA